MTPLVRFRLRAGEAILLALTLLLLFTLLAWPAGAEEANRGGVGGRGVAGDVAWAQVPQVYSRSGMGHVCPYDEHHAYAVRHLLVAQEGGVVYFLPLLWSVAPTPTGSGSLVPLYVDARRDFGIAYSETPFPPAFVHPVASQPPSPGDRLTVAAYQHEKAGMPRHGVRLTVEESLGGWIRTRGVSNHGSSGGCVFNEAGEVVGVMEGQMNRFEFREGRMETPAPHTGLVLAVWGGWGEIPEKWRDTQARGWTEQWYDEEGAVNGGRLIPPELLELIR